MALAQKARWASIRKQSQPMLVEKATVPGRAHDPQRVLVHVDTEKSELLVNDRFAYVSVSRAQHDAHTYANDESELSRALSRESSQRTATDVERQPTALKINSPAPKTANVSF
jgi:hypothetical protein